MKRVRVWACPFCGYRAAARRAPYCGCRWPELALPMAPVALAGPYDLTVVPVPFGGAP